EVPTVGALARDARLAVAPAERVAAGAAVGAAGELEVEQRLAERRRFAALDGAFRGGLDVGLDLGREMTALTGERVGLALTAAFARDLDALDVGDQRVDLLAVQRAAADEPPRRHRRERAAVLDDEADLVLVELVERGVQRGCGPVDGLDLLGHRVGDGERSDAA